MFLSLATWTTLPVISGEILRCRQILCLDFQAVVLCLNSFPVKWSSSLCVQLLASMAVAPSDSSGFHPLAKVVLVACTPKWYGPLGGLRPVPLTRRPVGHSGLDNPSANEPGFFPRRGTACQRQNTTPANGQGWPKSNFEPFQLFLLFARNEDEPSVNALRGTSYGSQREKNNPTHNRMS